MMPPLRRFLCRSYQRIMFLASFFLPWREPKQLQGLPAIGHTLAGIKKEKPLIVTDEGLHRLGIDQKLLDTLKEQGYEAALFHGVAANPTLAMAEEGFKAYQENGCDCLIGLGGGSAMDAAKAIAIKIAYPKKSLNRFKGILHVHRRLVPIFAIPTTAGTGSETTLAAVVVDEKTREKYQIDDPKLIPNYAVFEPSLLTNLPPAVIATTGMDAFTHAIEAYIGGSNTRGTKRAATLAMKLIHDHLLSFYGGTDREAHAKAMQEAAFLAGVAFTRAYVGYVHALAHALGGAYNVPHGYANAVLLPFVLEAYGRPVTKKLAKIHDLLQLGPTSLPEETKAASFVSYLRRLNQAMKIDAHFQNLVSEEDFAMLAKRAAKEGNPLYPVPRIMDARELETVLRKACGERL